MINPRTSLLYNQVVDFSMLIKRTGNEINMTAFVRV